MMSLFQILITRSDKVSGMSGEKLLTKLNNVMICLLNIVVLDTDVTKGQYKQWCFGFSSIFMNHFSFGPLELN